MQTAPLKVGALAQQTGLSVRTLHYYDEIGLLSPLRRTEGGHRLYGGADIARLQQIRSLQQLGLSLEEVRDFLDRRGVPPLRVIELQLDRLREQIELQRRLCDRLERIAERLRAAEDISVDEILQTIGSMTMFEKYYTPEQLAYLDQRRQEVGEDRIEQAEVEWTELIAAVRAEVEKGTDPTSERAQELARQWTGLIEEFTGGRADVKESLGQMWQSESSLGERHGIDQAMSEFVAKAAAAAKNSE